MTQLLNKQVVAQKRHTSPAERAQILLSLQNGYTTREIAKSQKITPSTVSRIRKRWLENHSLEDMARTGRLPIVKEPTQRRIVNLITSRRYSSAVEVQNRLQEQENLNFSTPTIRQVLRNNGLVSRVKRKMPYLSKRQKISI